MITFTRTGGIQAFAVAVLALFPVSVFFRFIDNRGLALWDEFVRLHPDTLARWRLFLEDGNGAFGEPELPVSPPDLFDRNWPFRAAQG